MAESSESLVESREELMISPSRETPIFRIAHFLKPSITSNYKSSALSLPPLPSKFDPQNCRLNVNFLGWRQPQKKWSTWVGKMASLHQSTWKRAGIYEAIFNSTYQIQILKNNVLILGIAELWSPETNSFIFSWGEATITLEDMMIFGYSVLGSPVYNPIETEELKGIEEKLEQARLEIVRTCCKKALQGKWLDKFMDSGSEIEHEAFLSLWLSRFVFPSYRDVINASIFPIAVHLAKGIKLALAPALLSSIYRDFTKLKEKIVSLTSLAAHKDNADNDNGESELAVTIWSPFQLVLVWVWERFVKLRPNPKLMKNGEPRLARWDNLRCEFVNVRAVLDSSKESFSWRPYTKNLENWVIPKFYREKEMWVSVDSHLDEELLSFIQCLRVSELVGVECTQQYLPHRVARQFGIDQDVPGYVPQSAENREVSWKCYSKPLSGLHCYIPSRYFETDVTARYSEWWNRLVSVSQGTSKTAMQQAKSSTSSKKTAEVSKGKEMEATPTCSMSSFQIRKKSPKKKNAGDSVKRSKASTKSSAVMKKVENISSFRNTPKISKRREDELPISSFKITRRDAKEKKKCSSDHIKHNVSPSSSKICSKVLKRKKLDDTSVALRSPAKRPKTSEKSLRRNDEEFGESTSPNRSSQFEKTAVEINKFPAAPGFPSKCHIVETNGCSEEIDDLTITQMLKLYKNHDDSDSGLWGNENNSLGEPQSHSSAISNEADKAPVLEEKLVQERTLHIEDLDNGQGGDSNNARPQSRSPLSSSADNGAPNVLYWATSSVVKDKHGEAAESSQQHSYYEGRTGSFTGNEKETGRYSFEALEAKLKAFEKALAERKAAASQRGACMS